LPQANTLATRKHSPQLFFFLLPLLFHLIANRLLLGTRRA
jgi:hypothetical protein